MATSPFDQTPNTDIGKAFGALSDSSQAKAVTNTFDESKGVAGRVNDITSYGGSLMTAARTRSKQKMAAKGLQNTSLAGQAGEQAVIETATPIAGADAQLYQQQQLANQSALNQVELANANNRMQIGVAGLNLGENARQFDSTLGWDKEKTGSTLMEQRRQFDATLGLEGKKLGQSQSQFEATLGLEGKKLDQQGSQFEKDLALQRDNLAAQREQFAQRLGMDVQQLQLNRDQLSQQDRQFLDQLNADAKQLAQQQSQFETSTGLEGQKLSQQDRQFLAELGQRNQQLAQQESQFTRDQANKVTLANLDATNREKLIKIESDYKKDIAGNENISRAWGSMMDSIGQIQNNPDLDSYAKQTMIQNVQSGFQSFTNFWRKVSGGGVDVSDLLNFGPAGSGSMGPPNVNQGQGDNYRGGRGSDGQSEYEQFRSSNPLNQSN